jgi:hypothetical protein
MTFAEYIVEVAGGGRFGKLLQQFRETIEVGVLRTEHIHIAWCRGIEDPLEVRHILVHVDEKLLHAPGGVGECTYFLVD